MWLIYCSTVSYAKSAQGTDILACCLTNPESAVDSVKSNKDRILKQDFDLLISTSSSEQTSSYLVARVAECVSWRRQWDTAIDKGVKGTRTLQSVFKELSRPKSVFTCIVCAPDKISESSWFEHVCARHPDLIGELTCSKLLDCLTQANSDLILNSCMYMSNCNSIWSIVFKLLQFLYILLHMHYGSLLLLLLLLLLLFIPGPSFLYEHTYAWEGWGKMFSFSHGFIADAYCVLWAEAECILVCKYHNVCDKCLPSYTS